MLSRLTGSRVVGYCTVAVAGILIGAGGLAFAASGDGVVKACANKTTGALRLAPKCKKTDRPVIWNVQGPQGLQGAPGARGLQGLQGTPGSNGANGTNGTNGTSPATNVTAREGSVISVANASTGVVTASCNAGEKATGGGSSISGSDAGWTVNEAFPTPASGTPTGWRVDATNNTGTANNLAAFVVCVSP